MLDAAIMADVPRTIGDTFEQIVRDRRFDQLNIGFRIPQVSGSFQPGVGGVGINPLVSTPFNYIDVGLNTAGDFKEGQKTVLGKVSGLDAESAIFVVVSLKVLD